MTQIPNAIAANPDFAWELATLYPQQGEWDEAEYLNLTDGTNRRIELTDGRLEFLTMPTEIHEALVQFLLFALHSYVQQRQLGKVYASGIRVRIRGQKFRVPDILFLHKDHFAVRHNRVWEGADLVMEVVSDDPQDRQRDYDQKLADYAEAGIAEYWIVDPQRRVVIVNQLQDGKYQAIGEFTAGTQATSALLPEFALDVAALFAVMDEIPE